jgi:hypothetical protein
VGLAYQSPPPLYLPKQFEKGEAEINSKQKNIFSYGNTVLFIALFNLYLFYV